MGKEQEGRGNRQQRRMGREEEMVWSQFYRTVGDPTVAAELIAHMDQDDDARRQHSGLYLRCRQSLRRAKERQARARAVGKALRFMLFGVLGWPFAVLARCWRFTAEAGLAFLVRHDEPATVQLRKIGKRPAQKSKAVQEEPKAPATGSESR
ncbi:hypothetical protein GCM10027277_25710 [Pseudoduganella ginsengisoli]|uniref:Uncharacterized protein n=1 Tax=Pseudoduganella ginsengisoli TaxID=1462440 RepID=A0A6L6PYS4_9BURK|nr:hypothetical protein [Pseudoduganella ginsengisoli]MTW02707.1 hypothetical protein [Pseudoduganella ginsengisoli]